MVVGEMAMSTQLKSQTFTDVVVKNTASSLGNIVAGELKGFKSPVSERRFALLAGDALIAAMATLLGLWGWSLFADQNFGRSLLMTYWYWYPVMIGVWWTLGWLNDLYHISSSHDRKHSLTAIFLAGGMGAAIFFALSLVMPFVPPFAFVLATWVLTMLGVLGWRLAYLSLSDALLPFSQRVLIVGRGARAKVIGDVLKSHKSVRYEVVGYVEDEGDASIRWQDDLPTLGTIGDLNDVAAEFNIHQVVVASEGEVSTALYNSLVHCQANGVPIAWMPDAYEKLLHRIPVEYIDPSWSLFAVQDKPIFRRMQLVSKRLLDLSIFLLALPVFLVVFPLLSIAIKLDSPGSIFYKQTRSGRGGQPFTIYKFRTMVSDAEKQGAQWAQKNDSRITRVGKFLRKTRLDELPQIINVFRGEMSFVGPRPERPEFIEELVEEIPFYTTRMLVKPGLSGWAQIHYDYGNTVEDARMKLEYDFYYVRYWSIWMDIYVLFRTIAVVALFKGM